MSTHAHRVLVRKEGGEILAAEPVGEVVNGKYKPRAKGLNVGNFYVCNTENCGMGFPAVCSGGPH